MAEKLTEQEWSEVERIKAWGGNWENWHVPLLLRALAEWKAERDALLRERDTASHFVMCEAHRSNKFMYSCVDCINRALAMQRQYRTEKEQAEAALAKAQADTVETIKFYDGALAERERERDQAQKSLTVLRTLMQGERLEVACSQRDALQAQLDQAEAALATAKTDRIGLALDLSKAEAERDQERQAYAALQRECYTERQTTAETIRGLRRELESAIREVEKMGARSQSGLADENYAALLSLREMERLLAAQPDAPRMNAPPQHPWQPDLDRIAAKCNPAGDKVTLEARLRQIPWLHASDCQYFSGGKCGDCHPDYAAMAALMAAQPDAPLRQDEHVPFRTCACGRLVLVNSRCPCGTAQPDAGVGHQKAAALETALQFAVGAISDAIYSEDGLDGLAGEKVLCILAEAKVHGTFDTHPIDRAQMLEILGLASEDDSPPPAPEAGQEKGTR